MFHKKVQENDVMEVIDRVSAGNPVLDGPENGGWNELTATKKRKVIREQVLSGAERVLKGYLKSPEPDIYGRVKVHDLEVTEGTNERLVDPRTIEWLVLKNVKYVAKK